MTYESVQEYINIREAVHYLATDNVLIYLFIIVSQKISKPGNTCETIGKVRIQYLALTENIERLCIRLRYPQPYMLYCQLSQHDAAIGKHVEVMEQRATIHWISGKSAPAIMSD